MFAKKNNYDEKYAIIESKYNQLSLFTAKSTLMKDAFTKRYRSALNNKMDLNLFLIEEDYFIDALLKKEQAAKSSRDEFAMRQQQENSFLTEQTSRIEQSVAKYSPIVLANSSNDELMRLFGAIDELDRNYWSSISHFLKDIFPLRTKSPLETIENRLWTMVSGQAGKPPQALAYYADCCRRGEALAIDDASFGAIKEASFFLNELLDLLRSVNFPVDSLAYTFLDNLINDFRITDIKRKKE